MSAKLRVDQLAAGSGASGNSGGCCLGSSGPGGASPGEGGNSRGEGSIGSSCGGGNSTGVGRADRAPEECTEFVLLSRPRRPYWPPPPAHRSSTMNVNSRPQSAQTRICFCSSGRSSARWRHFSRSSPLQSGQRDIRGGGVKARIGSDPETAATFGHSERCSLDASQPEESHGRSARAPA